MGTYWDSFIEEYGVKLLSHNFALITILEAFWYHSQETEDGKMKAYKIIMLAKEGK